MPSQTTSRGYRYPEPNMPADVALYLQQLAEDVNTDMTTTVGDTGWLASTLINSWINYTPASYVSAAYRRRGTRVTLRGEIASGAGNITTLPIGYRPVKSHLFIAPCSGGTATLTVLGDGNVSVLAYSSGGTNAWVSLDGISFDTN